MTRTIASDFWASGVIALAYVLHWGHAITVDMTGQNLGSVPQTIEPNVSNLVLQRNPLVTLHAGSFNAFLELLKLNVDYCKIEVIHDGTFAMQEKLKTISMKYNSIRSLPLDFGPPVDSLVSLTIFSAFDRYYDLKPYYFSAFKQLKYLRVGDYSFIPGRIHMPDNLTTLHITTQAPTVFPNLSNLTLLQHFEMNSKLTFIPDECIKRLDSLTYFKIVHNKLTVMPDVSHLEELKSLHVYSNSLPEIPKPKIAGLTRVKLIYAHNNLIHAMPNISYLSSVRYVYLHNNRIRHVPSDTLYGLPNLRFFRLEGNMISHIGGLQQLGLITLNLAGNQLADIPDLFHLRFWSVDINDNPLMCNQSLCWLRMWSWFTHSPLAGNPACAQPPGLEGVGVKNVHPLLLKCYNG